MTICEHLFYQFWLFIMKKLLVSFLLFATIILGWCSLFWSKNSDDAGATTWSMDASTGNALVASVKWKYSFEDENCNKYVALMECLLDKTPDAAKEQTANSFVKVMELWQGLEKTALPETCKNTMNMLQDQKEVFAKAGCELKE